MNTPSASSLPRRPADRTASAARRLLLALAAYMAAVSATVGAAAAVVGAGIPLDLLVAVV